MVQEGGERSDVARTAEDGLRDETEVKPRRRREPEIAVAAEDVTINASLGVRIVQENGPSRVVEWLDENKRPQRCIVPAEKVEHFVQIGGTYVTVADLLAGVPYGVPWEIILPDGPSLEPAQADELRRAGVWTVDDLGDHWPQAKRIVGSDMAVRLLKAAEEPRS